MAKTYRSVSAVKTTPRAKINPYISGLGLIVDRLLWDIKPVSWVSRRRIKSLKDRHTGEKAVILCNGPSLNLVDFDFLAESEVFTFGLNKINLLFDRTEFRPTVIVAVNQLVVEQNSPFFNETDIPLFLDELSRRWIPLRENIHYFHSAGGIGQFARDCSISINRGATVTYAAMQLAFHMGFQDVALVGCDHNFMRSGPAHKEVKGEEKDVDHFHSEYFGRGSTWQLPDLPASELQYTRARDIYELFGRRLVNCTEGGKLEVLPRASLKEFIRGRLVDVGAP